MLLALTFLLVAFAAWAVRRRHKQGLLKRYGFPGPTPNLFFGNWLELKKDRIKVMEEWAQRYGRVYGYYEGEVPKVVIGDMDVIKECFIKQSHAFIDRPPMVISVEPMESCLIGLKGDEWRHVRSTLNPSFTSAKMKLMLPTIHQCADTTAQILEQLVSTTGHTDINVSKLCQGISLDVITKCALGWQSDSQRNTEDPIIKTLLKILIDSGNFISDVCVLVPSLGAVLSRIFPFLSYGKLFARLQEHLRQLVESRKKSSAKVPDIVQLLLKARRKPTPTDDIENEVTTCAEMPFKTKLNTGFVTDTHIVSNCFLFLVSGFESTSATLAFTLYELATHPEEQWRLYRELMASFPVHEALTYEDLKVLDRFDAVIKEALRLYPPLVMVTSRTCSRDVPLATGHVIPTKAHVVLPTWNVLHDPDLWSDPYSFDPDRFRERLEGYQLDASRVVFGIGPRECIGKRLAELELKAVLSKLIRKFEFSVCSETEVPMKVKVPLVNVFPERDIRLRVTKRRSSKV